jgi:IS30 family transposase
MKYTTLSLKDRMYIEKALNEGFSCTGIAEVLCCHPCTITREIARGSDTQGQYQATYAHKKSQKRIRGRKQGKRKILLHQELQTYIHEKLQLFWSPEQIAQKLKDTYTDTRMHISHEAIYQYIYVLPRGELKKTLVQGLRQERAYRRSKRRKSPDQEARGKIQDMLSIHERPLEVNDRTIPGHWEGDLIMGKYKRSALCTLVERTTRYTLIILLKKGKTAEDVRKAMQKKLHTLPAHLVRSLTYDQGKEMSEHKTFTVDTGITVYFADPASPWQRGTNENTNGLIRQFFPKGTDFLEVTEQEVQRVEDLLNGRPRKCLGFAFPKEKFYDLVALDS